MQNLSQLRKQYIALVCTLALLVCVFIPRYTAEVFATLVTCALLMVLLRENFAAKKEVLLSFALFFYVFGSVSDLLNDIPELSRHWLISEVDSVMVKIGIVLFCMGFIRMLHEYKTAQTDLEKQLNLSIKRERLLNEQSLRDELTGVYNRSALFKHFDQMAIRHEFGTLAYINIDKFKEINTQHGHQYGDLVLVNFAKHLEQIAPSFSPVFRIGSDEFVVLLHNIEQKNCDDWVENLYSQTEDLKDEFGINLNISTVPYHAGTLSDPCSLLSIANKETYRERQCYCVN